MFNPVLFPGQSHPSSVSALSTVPDNCMNGMVLSETSEGIFRINTRTFKIR